MSTPRRSHPPQHSGLALLATLLVIAFAIGGGLAPALPHLAGRTGTPGPAGTPPPGPQLLLAEQVERRFTGASGAGGHGWGHRLVPVDPLTLAPLPGYAPLDLAGHSHAAAVSPDGRTLATFVYGDGAGTTGTLHLLDLPSWTSTPTAVTVAGELGWLGFGTDGHTLAWLAYHAPDRPADAPGELTLARYDRRSGVATVLAALPPLRWQDAAPLARPLRSGDRLAVYGVPATAGDRADGVPATAGDRADGVPHLLLVELAGGRVATDLRLAGVREGWVPGAADAPAPPAHFAPGLAWDVARDRLYVAHADADRITVVDLVRGTVLRQADIRDQAPPRDGSAPWAPRPVAPVAGGSRPTALSADGRRPTALSADGRRLFLAGQRSEVVRQPDGRWHERIIAHGIRVVDTAALREVGRLDRGGAVALSPAGQLLVHTARYEGGAPSPHPGDFRLHVFDAATLVELGRLDTEPGDIWFQGFDPDGRHAYLARLPAAVGGRPHGEYRLALFDLEGRRFVAERVFAHATSLIPLWDDQR